MFVFKVKSLVSCMQPGFANNPPTLEVVLLDKEGEKIKASLRSKSIEQYRPILTDGTTVLISNFSVAGNGTKNSKKYNITTYPFKILFVPSTIVNIIEDFNGPTLLCIVSISHLVVILNATN